VFAIELLRGGKGRLTSIRAGTATQLGHQNHGP
jgi:hypothetical protein